MDSGRLATAGVQLALLQSGLQSSVFLLQTAPSEASIGVWCMVRMKKVHINVENNTFLHDE